MVHHDTRCPGSIREFHDVLIATGVNAARVALSLIALNVIGQLNGMINVGCAIKRHDDREFFAREREVFAPTFFNDDIKLGGFGNVQPRHGGNLLRGLGNNSRVQVALIIPDRVAKLFFLLGITQVAAFCLQPIKHWLVDAIDENNGVIRRAGCREIESFRHVNLGGSIVEVGRIVHRDDCVANTNAQCRRSARVGCCDHGTTPSR